MNLLSKHEQLIWAATYAVQWSKGLETNEKYGVSMDASICIENAWAAVIEAREAYDTVKEGWGKTDEVYLMLDQMVQTPFELANKKK